MITYIISFFAFYLFAIVSVVSVFACSCAIPGTPNEELKKSTAVFSGIVTNIDQNLKEYGYKVKFDVERVWKGVSDKAVIVYTGIGAGDCGYEFKKSEKYLVYAYGESSLGTNICGRTTLISAAGEDLIVLGETKTVFLPTNTLIKKPLLSSNYLIFITILLAMVSLAIIYKIISSFSNK